MEQRGNLCRGGGTEGTPFLEEALEQKIWRKKLLQTNLTNYSELVLLMVDLPSRTLQGMETILSSFVLVLIQCCGKVMILVK